MPPRPIDEQAPLLTNLDPPAESQTEASAAELSGNLQERRTCWSIAWHAGLAILTICVLLVFIKHVIDSDDVEVSVSLAFLPWN